MKSRIIKIASVMLTICLMLSALRNVANAKNGDVVGYTKYTDIAAYINHFAIQSYNYKDMTYIVAEDLQNFGFFVVWNENDRTLNISRDSDTNSINQQSIPLAVPKDMVGKDALPILETDIRAYINGVLANSGNIDGRTVILFDDLKQFGKVEYTDSIRAIKLWVEDGLQMNRYMQNLSIGKFIANNSVDKEEQAKSIAINMALDFLKDYSFATLGDVYITEFGDKYYIDAILCGNGYTDDAHLIIGIDKTCENAEYIYVGTAPYGIYDGIIDLGLLIYEYKGWEKIDINQVVN